MFITQLILLICFACDLAFCDCNVPETLWERYECPIRQDSTKYQDRCLPIREYPTTKKVRGIILLFHGFTACPDAFKHISAKLVSLGYVTLIPLLPGHGLRLGYDCNNTPSPCILRGVTDGVNPSELPISKNGYIEFSDQMVQIANQEASMIPHSLRSPDFSLHVLGLSVGGALATHAAQNNNSNFSKVLVANPLYTTNNPYLDFKVKICEDSHDQVDCVRSLLKDYTSGKGLEAGLIDSVVGAYGPIEGIIHRLEKILDANVLIESYEKFLVSVWEILHRVHNSPQLLSLNIFQGEFGWGESCYKNIERGGICSFRLKHLIAVQAFSAHTVANINKIQKGVYYGDIHSDVDGYVRDSISFAIINSLNENGIIASRCRFKSNCTSVQYLEPTGRICGAPHSLFSQAEGHYLAPFNLFWEKNLLKTVINFFTTSDPLGSDVQEDNLGICVRSSERVEAGKEWIEIGNHFVKNAHDY